MQLAELTPDVMTYSAVINAMTRASKPEEARRWYEQACADGFGKDKRLREVVFVTS